MSEIWADPMVVQLLGVVGTVLSNGLGFSNLPAILDARRQGSLGNKNALVFPFLCVNCVSWCMYSVAKKDVYMFGGNVFVALMGLFYTTSSLGLMNCPQERLKLEGLLLLLLLIVAFVGFGAGMLQSGTQILGTMSLTLVLCLFASPLSTLVSVVRSKDSSSISRPFCVVQSLNCVVWLMYGFLTADAYITVPNVFGLLTAFLQAVVIMMFPAPVVMSSIPEDLEVGDVDESGVGAHTHTNTHINTHSHDRPAWHAKALQENCKMELGGGGGGGGGRREGDGGGVAGT